MGLRPPILVLTAIVLYGVQAAQATPEAGKDVDEAIDQRLFPDGRFFDFGTVPAGRVFSHTLRIVNRSHLPMTVSLHQS